MIAKQKIIIVLLFICLSSSVQAQKKDNCEERIDQLYAVQKLNLIFCSYYFERVSSFSGADTILDHLSFYRDTVNVNGVAKKDSTIIANLKKGICLRDTGLITEIQRWCETSAKIAQIRSEVHFTIEGYIEFLNDFKKTQLIINPFLTKDRTIYSLSDYEMEGIYFASIGLIKSLEKKEQNHLFKKLRIWDFR